MSGALPTVARSDRRGFTLIELLIVVVIIGVLASIAIPKFASTKGKSYIATMKSDLRNVATAQESWLADQGEYFAWSGDRSTPLLDPDGNVVYAPSAGVTVTTTAVPGGYGATATHSGIAGWTCAFFYGNHPPVPPAVTSSAVECAP